MILNILQEKKNLKNPIEVLTMPYHKLQHLNTFKIILVHDKIIVEQTMFTNWFRPYSYDLS
jgi:hypothetical protein